MAAICTILLDISIPGIKSLKEKRSTIKPIIHRLHRQFNVSVAEIDHQDTWDRCVLLCAIVSNDKAFSQKQAMKLVDHFVENFLSVDLLSHSIEFI
jgi:hypothetical protein